MKRYTGSERNRGLDASERRKTLEQDLAYYENKLAEVRDSKTDFAGLNLASLYESRTWHVRKLLTVLPVH